MPAKIIRTDNRAIVLDLSSGSELRGRQIAGLDVDPFSDLLNECMQDAGTEFAFGRFGEPRELYSNDNFVDTDNKEPRIIHLGIDLFCRANTPVYAPLAGVVELVANNDRELDYGPMLVLRHDIDADLKFWTLYGHLSMDTLENNFPGRLVAAGEQIAAVGAPPSNGNWPPHLHMQVVTDMLGLDADFPGVARKSDREYWFEVTPSPAKFFAELDPSQLEYS